jgi:thioesterase domain-containing protein/acyl carrier protein
VQAPRDEVERNLTGIWREVLEIDDLDIHENFFELGGHSLSAVRLLARVNERFGTELPLAALLSHPTVADLAIALLRGKYGTYQGRVIPLAKQPKDRSPLFLLPPRTGVGLVYAGLARELSGTAPTIALQAVSLSRTPLGSTSMPELAAEFISDLQRLQPTGAVRLCGYSAGGPVAHEMALQLLRIGRPVSQLILIDPYCADLSDWPDGTQPEEKDQAFWQACRDMIGDALQLRGSAADPVVDVTKRLWTSALSLPGWDRNSSSPSELLDETRRILPATMDLGIFLLLLEGVGNLWHAFASHQMTPLEGFGGQAWLIQPDADAPEFRRKREARWRALVGPGLKTQLVPGEHLSMLYRARTVEAIGAHLRGVLSAQDAA